MKKILFWSIPLVVLAAIITLKLWPGAEAPHPQYLPDLVAEPESAIRYPVEPVDAEPLPPLDKSDATFSTELARLFGQRVPDFIIVQDFVRRVVATVDNLPRDYVAPKLLPVRPAGGLPVTAGEAENLILSPRNAARYQRYVRLADTLPADALVKVYARFYSLFQEQYEKLGYPDKYFNDRVVQVIDHLLATPEVNEPVRLVQPRVLYQFADPKLERLSAGQKIILRVGRANADRLKAKLREIRRALVQLAPQ